jgi:myosin heavy subunit
MGVFALLDDESRIPQGTDMGFLDKLTKCFPSMPEFERPKGHQLTFVIQHFAGQVRGFRCGILRTEDAV